MNAITYGVAEDHYLLYGCERISYGLVVYADAASEGTASILASIPDISSDYAALAALAELCNRMGLSLIHLDDVVEDFLVGLSLS